MPRSRFVKSKAVIDTSCLQCLLLLDLSFPQYNLFRTLSLLYGSVLIPQHVVNEVSRKGRKRGQLNRTLQHYSFLKKCGVMDDYAAQLLYDRRRNPSATIDRGEAEAIIQAREIGASEVLIDERKGSKIAQAHSLSVKGVLGLIKEFKLIGVIPEAKPLFEVCRRHGFWISDALLKQVLEEIGEN
jgi:predicted nucleic acid-binding protein